MNLLGFINGQPDWVVHITKLVNVIDGFSDREFIKISYFGYTFTFI